MLVVVIFAANSRSHQLMHMTRAEFQNVSEKKKEYKL